VSIPERGSAKGKIRVAASFEDLHVYQRARELTNEVYRVTRQGPFARDFALVNQIRHAAVSIMSNIAEGHERGSKAEFIQFLYVAKGSSGEVRAQLCIANDQGYIPAEEFEPIYNMARTVGGMLSNFIGYLKRSPYRGGGKYTVSHGLEMGQANDPQTANPEEGPLPDLPVTDR
jgi:four helix bundle protein